MTDARGCPEVVQGGEDRFAERGELPQGRERQEALVDPVQMDDVCLLYPWMGGDVTAPLSGRDTKKLLA